MAATELNILYEDNHLLVVEKPYGVPSQSDTTGDEDMLTICKRYIKEKYGKPGDVYMGLVHRLDRPTRGIMVFARTSKAAARLSEQVRQGEFKKTYLAVLIAAPAQSPGELWDYLVKDGRLHIAKLAKEGDKDAKKAGLKYEVLGLRDGLCLVRVELMTGRFHQIRAQFSARGCPVWGDMKYGDGKVKGQLALFAGGLSFKHPVKDERMSFSLKPEHYPFSIFEREIGGIRD